MAIVVSFAHFLSEGDDFSSEMGGDVGGGLVARRDMGNEGGKGWMMDNVLLTVVDKDFGAEYSQTAFYSSQVVLCYRVCY